MIQLLKIEFYSLVYGPDLISGSVDVEIFIHTFMIGLTTLSVSRTVAENMLYESIHMPIMPTCPSFIMFLPYKYIADKRSSIFGSNRVYEHLY